MLLWEGSQYCLQFTRPVTAAVLFCPQTSSVRCSQMGVPGSKSHEKGAGVRAGDIQGEAARLRRADGQVTRGQRRAGGGPGQTAIHPGSWNGGDTQWPPPLPARPPFWPLSCKVGGNGLTPRAWWPSEGLASGPGPPGALFMAVIALLARVYSYLAPAPIGSGSTTPWLLSLSFQSQLGFCQQ